MSDGTWAYDHVTVLLARNPDETEPHVVLNYDADDMLFTLAEAEVLKLLLESLLRAAEQG